MATNTSTSYPSITSIADILVELLGSDISDSLGMLKRMGRSWGLRTEQLRTDLVVLNAGAPSPLSVAHPGENGRQVWSRIVQEVLVGPLLRGRVVPRPTVRSYADYERLDRDLALARQVRSLAIDPGRVNGDGKAAEFNFTELAAIREAIGVLNNAGFLPEIVEERDTNWSVGDLSRLNQAPVRTAQFLCRAASGVAGEYDKGQDLTTIPSQKGAYSLLTSRKDELLTSGVRLLDTHQSNWKLLQALRKAQRNKSTPAGAEAEEKARERAQSDVAPLHGLISHPTVVQIASAGDFEQLERALCPWWNEGSLGLRIPSEASAELRGLAIRDFEVRLHDPRVVEWARSINAPVCDVAAFLAWALRSTHLQLVAPDLGVSLRKLWRHYLDPQALVDDIYHASGKQWLLWPLAGAARLARIVGHFDVPLFGKIAPKIGTLVFYAGAFLVLGSLWPGIERPSSVIAAAEAALIPSVVYFFWSTSWFKAAKDWKPLLMLAIPLVLVVVGYLMMSHTGSAVHDAAPKHHICDVWGCYDL